MSAKEKSLEGAKQIMRNLVMATPKPHDEMKVGKKKRKRKQSKRKKPGK
jgi:hypothetical protein